MLFYCFLFLRLLRCFSSPGSPLTVLCVQTAVVPTSSGQVSPFGNPRVKGCLPPNRGLSQAATSFIVFLSQGIRHILLLRFSHTFDFKFKSMSRKLQSNYTGCFTPLFVNCGDLILKLRKK